MSNENNFFFVHGGSREVEVYTEFCSYLNNRFNYWGIRAARFENYTPIDLAIQKVTKKYIEKIKIESIKNTEKLF
jgi:thioesterase domain-containing protein